jgi:hypothetical protein
MGDRACNFGNYADGRLRSRRNGRPSGGPAPGQPDGHSADIEDSRIRQESWFFFVECPENGDIVSHRRASHDEMSRR